jgi:hypothetical protein
MFCKRKREKRKPSFLRLCRKQKGNGINKSEDYRKAIFYAVVFLPLEKSLTTAASFAFAFARISYKTQSLAAFLNQRK